MKEISGVFGQFCTEAAQMFQVADEESDKEEQEPSKVTYMEMKQLMSQVGSSGEEMFKLRGSLLYHLDDLFKDKLITSNLVSNILHHTYSKMAFHDALTTELVTMIIIKFHIVITDLKKQLENLGANQNPHQLTMKIAVEREQIINCM